MIQASQSPARVILAGRSLEKIQDSINSLKQEFSGVEFRGLKVDLSLQRSVREAAAEVMSWDDVPIIDIIVNNAAVMGMPERILTEDGIELHFATNYIGHWLLSCLIMSKLIRAAEHNPKGATRIVNVSSASPQVSGIRWSDMNFDKKNKDLPVSEQPDYPWFEPWGYTDMENLSYIPLDGYNRSKVGNVLFGIAANERLFQKNGILSLSLHPGLIATELGRDFAPETLEALKVFESRGFDGAFVRKSHGAGAATSLVAALDPKLAVGVGESRNGHENWGAYLDDCQISNKAHPLAVSSEEAEKLWNWSEKLVGEAFTW